jgi:trigger factor
MEYVQNEPMAAAQLRAPLFEDKVVDFLFDKATITDRAVTREILQAEIESTEVHSDGHVHGPDCNHDHDHDHGAAAKPKKAKKAKASDDGAAEEAPAAEDKPKKAKKAKAADAAPAEEPAAAAAAEDKPKKSRAKKKAD